VTRVVRVAPDVTAVERVFDYLVPDELDARVRVGTIVRVPLHGRRVRGWVVEDDVDAEVRDRLLPIAAVVSEGPPRDIVELAGWIAWRWCGPWVAVLRSASPANRVSAAVPAELELGPGFRAAVVRHPPLRDRRDVVEGLLAPAGSTIVVVADGARAAGLARTLAGRGHDVALLHSDASDAERTAAWRRAAAGACVVVGGRIAALAPVPDLAAVVVVDDADEALQEERVPTWHARDVLLERARRTEARWTVLSAAPTVEAEAAAGFAISAPARDIEITGWPRTIVVDRRKEPPGAGLLSEPFAAALREAKGLAVCVVNRRGRFRVLACDACHALLRWDRTDDRPRVCDSCGAVRLRVLRSGVTRIREELEALSAGQRVVDVDADTEAVPEADILIGTESVLHRADVRRARPALVAYLDLDQELLAPRYRAAAQAHWLVTRGAQLLARRPRSETALLLQTRAPEHEVVRAVAEGSPAIVGEAEADRRRVLHYPPFGAVAELSGDVEALGAAADALRAFEVAAAGITVLGPSDGRALVRAPDWDMLAEHLGHAVRRGRAEGRLRAAVDPPRI
jgi:primosomal protein N' (replication factor Y)